MARRKALIVAITSLAASAMVIAAAAAQGPKSPPATEPESNEQIVADFLGRKERAERAQRAILLDLRRGLDRKRAEFDEARRKFDEARDRYAEIVGPLTKQGVMNPEDPRLPYEYEVRRSGAEFSESRPGYLSQRPAEERTKSSGVDASRK